MVDSKDKPDDQIDRASKLRNMREARVTSYNGPVKFEIEDYRECGFDKPTDFMAPRKNSGSTVTQKEWLQIKAAVTAGFSEDEQRVLAANIDTLSDLEKVSRDMTKKAIGSKIKDLKKAMAGRKKTEERTGGMASTHVVRLPDQVVYDIVEELLTKLDRFHKTGKKITFDLAKVVDHLQAIKEETRPR